MILDNPIWEALSTRQQHFNTGNETVKFFPAEVAPFASVANWDAKGMPDLLEYLPAGRNFFILLAHPIQWTDDFEIVYSTPLYQMVCEQQVIPDTDKFPVKVLDQRHIPQMIELTQLTKPGPFTERTIEFGNYQGIFDGERLVAMAGERLKLPGYTEVSAICTHPDYLGRGYGSALIAKAVSRIFAAGDIPYLHVKQENESAVALYKKHGFSIRTDIYFAIFRKKPTANG